MSWVFPSVDGCKRLDNFFHKNIPVNLAHVSSMSKQELEYSKWESPSSIVAVLDSSKTPDPSILFTGPELLHIYWVFPSELARDQCLENIYNHLGKPIV